MKTHLLRSILLIVLLITGLNSTMAGESKPPELWRKVDATRFAFYLPPDFKDVPTQGIDSYVERYRGTDIDLSFDYGPYSDPLTHKEMPGYLVKPLKVDGKDAKIVSFRNPNASGHRFPEVIAIHFPDLGDGKTRLTMYATCRDSLHYATVERVFSTLRFAPRRSFLAEQPIN
jgi:hypothetical protein